jgi:hypothetical protein
VAVAVLAVLETTVFPGGQGRTVLKGIEGTVGTITITWHRSLLEERVPEVGVPLALAEPVEKAVVGALARLRIH